MRARSVLLLLAPLGVPLLSACRRAPSDERRTTASAVAASASAPSADLRQRGHHVLGLYFARDPGAGPLETFQREAGTTHFKVTSGKETAPVNDSDTVYMAAPDLTAAPPPSGAQLELFSRGFGPADRAQAEKITAVRVLAFSLHDAVAVRDADRLAERVAAANGAYLFDTATRELFTLPAWRSLRLSAWNGERPIVARHVTVHAYRDGAAYRAVSLGMEKFGVPDLALNALRGEDLPRVDTLMQLALQSLVDQGKTTVHLETKSGELAVHLVAARPADGDADNRLVQIADPVNPLLGRLGDADHLRSVRQDDPEVTAAVAQVRARVPALSRRFAAGLGPNGHLRVKGLFENEAMWIEVVTWENGELRGPLTDHPQLANSLVGGQIVGVWETEMLDYQLTGVAAPEGPFLQEILERKGRTGSP